ncbi:hypothetical protein Pmani_028396 [Petrolisthes manimaculis]|uniref:Ig-like domain-containing protein n=1 Tax=Petrolisthes manimaculis TaxID=1843537 RepID=A0AAE1P2B7_9EUCA|nr:hypothetical protein Pmani_028396 [Petrolisthes manimaculis]
MGLVGKIEEGLGVLTEMKSRSVKGGRGGSSPMARSCIVVTRREQSTVVKKDTSSSVAQTTVLQETLTRSSDVMADSLSTTLQWLSRIKSHGERKRKLWSSEVRSGVAERTENINYKQLLGSQWVLLMGVVFQVVVVCLGTSMAAAVAMEVVVDSNTSSSCLPGCSCGVLPTPLLHENLTMLDCSFAGLRSFPEEIPSGVEALSVRGNSISHVLDSVLAQLIFLRELDLSHNKIKFIGRGGVFRNLTRLEVLHLGKNAISTIFRDNLVGPRALHRLVLADNKINYIEDEALVDLVFLEDLDLQHNYLGSLYQEWFTGLNRLTSLNLDHNRIHNVSASVFRPLTALRELHLAGNRISNLDPRAFSRLTQLQILHLEENLLTTVPTSALQSLPSLVTLVMDQNPLAKVKPLDFSHLAVKTISLCYMPQLLILDAKAFYNLPNVTSLLLHHNPRLAYVDPLAFKEVNSLKDLQLQNNSLIGLQPEMARYLSPGVTISLQDNPLLCDCNVRWLRQSMKQVANMNSTQIGEQKAEKAVSQVVGQQTRQEGRETVKRKARKAVKKVVQQNPGQVMKQMRKDASKEDDRSRLVMAEPGHLMCAAPPAKAHKLVQDIPLPRLPKTCAPTIVNLMEKEVVAGKMAEYKVLDCRALGNPRPRLHWVLPDGTMVNSSLNDVRRNFFPSGTLVYYHLVASDRGHYTCVAENSVGMSTSSLFLNVTGIDIQLLPERVSPTTVTLVWRGTERRAFPSYKIIYSEVSENGSLVGEPRATETSSTRRTYSVARLHPHTSYHFCLGHEDSAGYWLEISCCQAATLSSDHLSHGGISSVSSIVAAGAVGMVLVVTMIVCLSSILSRRYRHHLYETPDKGGAGGSTGLVIPLDNLYRPLLAGSS